MAETWLLCSACRTDIPYGSKYFQCSVSTCNRARMRLVFCSVVCWDSHVATLRHRDAWAEDKIAPTRVAWERELNSQPPEPSRLSPGAPRPGTPAPSTHRPFSPGAPAPSSAPALSHTRPFSPGAPAPSSAPAPSTIRPYSPGAPPPQSTRPFSPSTPAQGVPVHGAPAPQPARRIIGDPAPAPVPASSSGAVHLNDIVDRDMMIVVSKLKKYIKDRSGMNCSDAVAEVLSDHVRILCDDSIRAAGREERKTVLDRDVPRPRRA
jgi:hypothetical protein